MGRTRDTLKRRVRRTVKWGGAGLTVLLVVVWIGSGWIQFTAGWSPGYQIGLGRGACGLEVRSYAAPSSPFRTQLKPPRGFELRWIPWLVLDGSYTAYILPLWCPALLSLLATAAAWRADLKYLRRARVGLCPACGYDRAGLAAVSVCPECGAAPRL